MPCASSFTRSRSRACPEASARGAEGLLTTSGWVNLSTRPAQLYFTGNAANLDLAALLLRGKEPVVRLTPVASKKRHPTFGILKGKLNIPDSFFFDPLPEDELKLWEGGDEDPFR